MTQHPHYTLHHQAQRHGNERYGSRETIKRGILQTFDRTTYTASVLLYEATSAAITLPVATHIDGSSALSGALCAVLFFDEQNQNDAVVIAVYPNGMQGVPLPAPGRVTFVTGYQQFTNILILNNTQQTFSVTGGGSGLPANALGIVYKAYFSSPTIGAYMQIAPHTAAIAFYGSLGNVQVTNQLVHSNGLVPVDSAGRIDVRASNGDCTATLYTYGYVV